MKAKYYVKADPPPTIDNYSGVDGYYVASDGPDGHEVRHPTGYFEVSDQRPWQVALFLANTLRDEMNAEERFLDKMTSSEP
jgi:hypothetical protein